MNSPDTLTPWLTPLGWLALEAAVVVLAALALQPLVRAAAARRSLWRAVLVALGLLLAAEFTGVTGKLSTQLRAAWQSAFAKPAEPQLLPPVHVAIPIPDSPTPIPAFFPEPEPLPDFADFTPAPPAPAHFPTLPPAPIPTLVWPAWLWLAGLVALLARSAWTHAGFAWLRLRHFLPAAEALRQRVQELATRIGLRRRVRVLASERLRAPAAFGWVRPGVAVPGDFTARFAPAQQDVMLAHELAHLAARDPLWQLLADLVTAALWWHPLAWVARHQHRLAAELAADDASQALPDGPVVLAECLLVLGQEVAAAPRAPLGMAGFRSQLGRRVERLVALPRRDWSAPGPLRLVLQTTTALLALAALALLPGCAANRAASEPPSRLVTKWWQAKSKTPETQPRGATLLIRRQPKPVTVEGRVRFNGTPLPERDIPIPLGLVKTVPLKPTSTMSIGSVTTVTNGKTNTIHFETGHRFAVEQHEMMKALIRELSKGVPIRGPVPKTPSLFLQDFCLRHGLRHNETTGPLVDYKAGHIIFLGNKADSEKLAMLLGSLLRAPLKTRNHRVAPDGGLADVLVYVKEGLPNQTFPAPTNTHSIRIQGYEYQPYITAVQTGQPIRWETDVNLNFHPTPTNPANREFNRVLDPGRPVEAKFTAPEFFLRTKDDVHPWLFGYVSVLPHPYFAVTDAEGRFRFPQPLPPGKYTLAAVHRQAGMETRELVVDASFDAAKPIALTLGAVTGRDAILRKLAETRLPEVTYDGLPLPEVVRFLSSDTKKNDPERRGVHFTQAEPTPNPAAVDLDTFLIKVTTVLRDVSVLEALDAILKTADARRPTDGQFAALEYHIETDRVVFRERTKPVAAVASAPAAITPRQREIRRRLEAVVLPSVQYDGLPLPEVIKLLEQDAKRHDPEKKGFNFLVSSTGQPDTPEGLVDLDTVLIQHEAVRKNATVREVLDAICQTAEVKRPDGVAAGLKYSVEGFGILFTPDHPQSTNAKPAAPPVLVPPHPPLPATTPPTPAPPSTSRPINAALAREHCDRLEALVKILRANAGTTGQDYANVVGLIEQALAEYAAVLPSTAPELARLKKLLDETKPHAPKPGANLQDAPQRSYVVAVGDEVRMNVYQRDNLQTQAKVQPDGTLTLPLIGAVKAAGQNISQLRNAIRDAYESAHFRPAHVTVTLMQSAPPLAPPPLLSTPKQASDFAPSKPPTREELLERKARLEADIKEAEKLYRPSHPKMMGLRKQLESVEEALRQQALVSFHMAVVSVRLKQVEQVERRLQDPIYTKSERLRFYASIDYGTLRETPTVGNPRPTNGTVIVPRAPSASTEAWAELERQTLRMESALKEQAQTYAPTHPKMQVLKRQLEAINRLLEEEEQKAAAKFNFLKRTLQQQQRELLEQRGATLPPAPVAADVRRLQSNAEAGARKAETSQSLVTSAATNAPAATRDELLQRQARLEAEIRDAAKSLPIADPKMVGLRAEFASVAEALRQDALSSTNARNISVGRQFFVDDFLIASNTLKRTWHQPVLSPELPLFALPSAGPLPDPAPFCDRVWYDTTNQLFRLRFAFQDEFVEFSSTNGVDWPAANVRTNARGGLPLARGAKPRSAPILVHTEYESLRASLTTPSAKSVIRVGFGRDTSRFSFPENHPRISLPQPADGSRWSDLNPMTNGFLVVGRNLHFYFGGRVQRAGEAHPSAAVGLATLRRDGFASLDAGPEGGVMTTKPVTFTGKFMFVNFKTNAPDGELRVEILHPDGRPIEVSNNATAERSTPFSRANCIPLAADQTLMGVNWLNWTNGLASLVGRPVRFRFHLKNASLYSFWVGPGQLGRSLGRVAGGGPHFTNDVDTIGNRSYQPFPVKPLPPPKPGTLTVGDTVKVEVIHGAKGNNTLRLQVRVQSNGKVSLSGIAPVVVAGKTPEEARAGIREAFLAAKVDNPVVTVTKIEPPPAPQPAPPTPKPGAANPALSPFAERGEKVAEGRLRGAATNAVAANPSPQPSPLAPQRAREPESAPATPVAADVRRLAFPQTPDAKPQTLTASQSLVTSAATNLPAAKNWTPAQRAILQRLDAVVFPEIAYDCLPLGEVVKMLQQDARKYDPEKKGFNFLLNSAAQPLEAPARIDLNTVLIKVTSVFRGLTLAQVLDLVCKTASEPIQFTVEDYGIVFTQRDRARPFVAPRLVERPAGVWTPAQRALLQRLDTVVFPEITYDGLPLPEVVKFLETDGRKHDPEKRGFNFLLNSTGQPGDGANWVDLDVVLIHVNSVLRGLTLNQVLDVVCKSADVRRPDGRGAGLQFAVEDYGIIFTPRDIAKPFVAPRRVEQPAGAAVRAKLDQTVIPQIAYDGIPLPEVLKMLTQDARRHDPDKQGVNLLTTRFFPDPPPGWHGFPAGLDGKPLPRLLDAKGNPIPDPQPPRVEPPDLDTVIINVPQVLNGLTLAQVLDVVCQTASRPITYRVEDFGVLITPKYPAPPAPKPGGGVPAPPAPVGDDVLGRARLPNADATNLKALAGRLVQAQVEATKLRADKGPQHPDTRANRLLIAALEQAIDDEKEFLAFLARVQPRSPDIETTLAIATLSRRHQALLEAKIEMAVKADDLGPQHPESKRLKVVMDELTRQVDDGKQKLQPSSPPKPGASLQPAPVAADVRRLQSNTEVGTRNAESSQSLLTSAATIVPGDALKLLVVEDDSYNAIYPVKRDGTITVKGVGRVPVGGRRLSDAQAAVKALLEATQLSKATVTLEFVGEPSSRTNTVSTATNDQRVIYLAGEFITPGPLKLAEGESLTLTNALLRSGGITPNGDLSRTKLLRIENGQGAVEEVNVAAILSGAVPPVDKPLNPGDIIMVPVRPPVVFVTGSVVRPGSVGLVKDEPLTAYAAILRAGGPTAGASVTNGYIVREAGNGEKAQIPFSVKGANIALQRGDIVVVPGLKAEGKNGVLHEPELKAALQKALGEPIGSELANAPLLRPMNPPKPRAAAAALPTNSTTLLHPTNPPKPVQSPTGALPVVRAAVRDQIASGNLGEPVRVTVPGSNREARTATVQATEVRTVAAPHAPVAADVRRLTSPQTPDAKPQTPPASQSLLTSAATNKVAAPDSLQAAQEEALRRQERRLVLDKLLGEAKQFQRIKSWTNAVGRYEEAIGHAKVLGGGVAAMEKPYREALAGLVHCRIQLAIGLQEKHEFKAAAAEADKIFGFDPKNAEAEQFKRFNERVEAAHKGRLVSPSATARKAEVIEARAKVMGLVRDGRLHYEVGQYPEARKRLEEAIALDPANEVAYYYLRLIQESQFERDCKVREQTYSSRVVEVSQTWNEAARSQNGLPVPNPYHRTNSEVPFLTHSSKGAQRINRKLEEIVLPEVHFDAVPLAEVVKRLSEDAKKFDPEPDPKKKGLNLLINDVAPPAPLVDANGNPVPVARPVALSEGLIRISTQLRNLTLRQALDVICKNAELPTQFSVEEYAIAFIPRGPVAYYSRMFRVNPDTFIQGLQGVVGSPVLGVTPGGGNQPGAAGQNQPATTTTTTGPVRATVPATVPATQRTAAEANALVRQFFQSAGVTALGATNGSTRVFFNPENGLLIARGTTNDLRLIEQAIQKVQPPLLTPTNSAPRTALPNPIYKTNNSVPFLTHSSKGAQLINRKLDEIILPEVRFDSETLPEVAKWLDTNVRRHDPEKKGLNFLINNVVSDYIAPAGPIPPVLDPKGNPIVTPPRAAVIVKPVLADALVKLPVALTNLTLRQALDVICKTTWVKPVEGRGQGLKYSVEDYAIVFSPKLPEQADLFSRIFKVDPETFLTGLKSVAFAGMQLKPGTRAALEQALRERAWTNAPAGMNRFTVSGVTVAKGGTGVVNTNVTSELNQLVRHYFTAAGVANLGVTNGPDATQVFFNDRNGLLLVRASLQDLDIIQQAIELLNTKPPTVKFEVQVFDAGQREATRSELALHALSRERPLATTKVLAAAEVRDAIKAFGPAVRRASAPSAMIASGRSARVEIPDPREPASPKVAAPGGLTLSLAPVAWAGGIELSAIVTDVTPMPTPAAGSEFPNSKARDIYDHVLVPGQPAPVRPLSPLTRTRQGLQQVSIPAGHSVLLTLELNQQAAKSNGVATAMVNSLVVIVTPTLVDSDTIPLTSDSTAPAKK